MTVQVGKSAATAGNVALDAPIFDPVAFRLSDEQAAIIGRARELGQSVFAGRAAAYDRRERGPRTAGSPQEPPENVRQPARPS